MTCIVAVKGEKKIVFGADRMTSNGWEKFKKRIPKLFKCGDITFGACGCPGFSNAYRYRFKAPKFRPHEQTSDVFVQTTLIKKMREFEKKEELDGSSSGFIMGVGSQLYQYHDGTVYEFEQEYYADGSGGMHAYAAMYAAKELGRRDPRKIAELGLQAADRFVPSCDGNFDFIEIAI